MRITKAVACVGSVGLAWGLGAAFHPARPAVEFTGILRGTIGRNLRLDAPDQPGHRIGLAETTGSHESTGPTPFMPGAAIRTVEIWSLERPGTERGFLTVALGSDSVVASYEGTAAAADSGRSRLAGRFTFIRGTGRYAGITGEATFEGYLRRPAYELVWRGTYTLPATR
jgi:hypothetical protein